MLIPSLGIPVRSDAQSKGKLWLWASCPCLPDGYHWAQLGFISFGELTSSHTWGFMAWGPLFNHKLLHEELSFPRSRVTKCLSFYKKNLIFFNVGIFCLHHAHAHTPLHMQPITKHKLRHIFGLSVNPFLADADIFFFLSPEVRGRLFRWH